MKTKFHGRDINVRRVGILTGGGDCAGLNAVISGLLRRMHKESQNLPQDEQMELIGLFDGWKSLTVDPDTDIYDVGCLLKLDAMEDAFRESGTILGTSRTNIYSEKNVVKGIPKVVIENIKRFKLDVLCVLGGDDTLGAAIKLSDEFDFPVLGAPKTMDNDIQGTERTFGFESAYTEAARVIANINTTAKSHHRIFVIEVMGRNAGWVALCAGVAAGAGATVLPEEMFSFHELASRARKMKKLWNHGTIVVAEGARLTSHEYPSSLNNENKKVFQALCADPKYALARARLERPDKTDDFGHPVLSGVGEIVTSALVYLTPEIEYRLQICGHAIRACEHPQDTLLGLRFGSALFDYMRAGKFGYFPALSGDEIIPAPLFLARGGRNVSRQTHDDLFQMRNLIDFW